MGCGKDDCGCEGGKAQATIEAGGKDACMAAMEEMGRRAPEHANLEPFVGTWDARVRMWMGPGDPMESGGVMQNTLELAGKWLRHEFQSDEGFAGSGFMGFNKATGKYEGFWIDTMSTFMQTESGDYDARTKTFHMTSQLLCPIAKVPLDKRTVIRIESADRHVMEMYFSGQGQPESKAMEITYTRRK
jgi:hypothetical protein